uniref:Uncharacterized protein n=1 Tax=Timema douglasi TaxID=61478 RepID=A0A7R8ZJ63_TIMDO|nr:unnamed protein product [Timema douglasi]
MTRHLGTWTRRHYMTT